MEQDLARSPLEAEHRALGAKLGPFGGWLMPIEYAGTLAEHRAVRERAGLFDLSHLGKVDVAGPSALEGLQGLLTNDIASLAVGRARYSLLLNERGGVEEDLIVYRLSEDRYFVVPNASNTERVVAELVAAVPGGVRAHEDWCFLGVQGPRSAEVLAPLFPEASGMRYLDVVEAAYQGDRLVLARTGYTGERGYELFAPEAAAPDLWKEISDAGGAVDLRPCGLGARDVLRLEMGYPLYGQDLMPERTPIEAGLGWAVKLDKGSFRGRDALVQQERDGPPSRLHGLVMLERRHIPRAHQRVLGSGGADLGEVTSGTFSPTLERGIALAYLSPADAVALGDEVEVDIRGRHGPARVTETPFVDRSPR